MAKHGKKYNAAIAKVDINEKPEDPENLVW